MRSRGGRQEAGEEAALRLVLEHAAELLRFARRFSHCADDAHDAYQRAVEILVRRMRTDPPVQPLPWLRTVLRHEALAVRAEREQLLGRVELDLDRHEDRAAGDPAEQAVGHERLRHTAEALRRLKPQEATALVLRAEGLSYAEICTRTGWTYTRTNRAVTEGRRALLQRLGAIESGAECARWLPLLSALADGEATASQLAELRPHLRACPSCRATLRDCHGAPAHVAVLVPAVAIQAAIAPAHGSLLDHAHIALHAVAERATLLVARVQGAVEALPATKVAAVAASTAALAGGGVALDQATDARPHTQTTEAAATATPRGLTTVALPVRPRASDRGSADHTVRGASGEFAAGGARPPEFASQAAPSSEYSTAPRASAAGLAAPASAAAPASPAADPPSVESEFGGP